MSRKVAMTLKNSVEAHNEVLDKMEFRPVSVKDIVECGYPYTFSKNDEGEADAKVIPGVIIKYIAKLTDVPRSTVLSMSVEDFNNATGIVMGFFGEEEAE